MAAIDLAGGPGRTHAEGRDPSTAVDSGSGGAKRTRVIDAAELGEHIKRTQALHGSGGTRSAEILFILDCTESMSGEIGAMQHAIIAFADTIKLEGVRAKVGLIGFRDRLIGEEARVLKFGGEVFTSDTEAFRSQVSRLIAAGGGDEPASSLDAVLLATRQPFSEGVNRVFVLVTDAPPHIPDRETRSVDQVVQAIRNVKLDQLYLVIRTRNPSSQVYLRLLESGVRGMAFDLGENGAFAAREENFKRTLMALGKTISQGTLA